MGTSLVKFIVPLNYADVCLHGLDNKLCFQISNKNIQNKKVTFHVYSKL